MGGRRRSAWVAALAVLACGGWAAPSETFVYRADSEGAIGRANLDGSGIDPFFILVSRGNAPGSVAVDAEHVYWVNERTGTIGG